MWKALLLITSLAISWSCQAESGKTLGDVLDAGASKLSSAEVEAQVIGSWYSFKGQSGSDFNLSPVPDGRVMGNVKGFKGAAEGSGTWKLGEDGKLCIDFHYAHGSLVGDFNRCHFWFSKSGNYWSAPSESNRDAPTLEILSLKK